MTPAPKRRLKILEAASYLRERMWSRDFSDSRRTTSSEKTQGISVVIPAHNEERYIKDCVLSIAALKDPAIHEIIVVDNASTDRTAEIARSVPGVTVVREPHKGITWARQKGLDIATGDLYAAIDADVRISPQWLATVKRRFQDPNIVSLSGPYGYYDLTRWKNFIIRFLLQLILAEQRIMGKHTELIRGGNTVYRMPALRAAGGFNTDILFYGEDVDTFMRIRKFGKTAYDPRMSALSSGRRFNAEGFWKMLFIYRVNSVWQHLFAKPLLHITEHDWR